MAVEIGWAIDFIDKPADNLDLNFWSGNGDITLVVDGESVNYKGANGVISLHPPREEANNASRITAVLDASDPNIRKQLRRDVGPLRVRVIWIYRTELPTFSEGNTIIRQFSGNPSFGLLNVRDRGNFSSLSIGTVFSGRFVSTGGLTGVSTGITYWFKKYTTNVIAVFSNETDADNALDDVFDEVLRPGRTTIDVTPTNSSDYTIQFDSDIPDTSAARNWTMTSKRFIGKLSSPVISGGTYSVDIESMISDIDRGRPLYWSNDTQLGRHPGDKCFEYMKDYAINGIDTKWPP